MLRSNYTCISLQIHVKSYYLKIENTQIRLFKMKILMIVTLSDNTLTLCVNDLKSQTV